MQIKSNKGVVGTDLSIAVIILVLFITILTTIFYQIGRSNLETKRNAVATDYAVAILEKISLMPYDEFIQEDTDLNALCSYNEESSEGKIVVSKGYEVNITKSEEDKDKEEYLKEVTVTIRYTVANQEKEVTMTTLKCREV